MVKIEVENNGRKGRFVLLEGGKEAGEMTFNWDGESKIIIDHTLIDKEYGGKGYAKQLMSKAVAFAREKNVKIVPECSFVEAMFKKDESLKDVRA